MDAAAALRAFSLIYQYVNACAEFSSKARSLAARFDWDLWVLEKALIDLEQGRAVFHAEKELLLQGLEHVNNLVDRLRRKWFIIHDKSLLGRLALGATWLARKSELEDLEKELYTWTLRLSSHSLNPLIRRRIPNTAELPPEPSVPPVISPNNRLWELARLAGQDKETRAGKMLLEGLDTLTLEISNSNFISNTPLSIGNKRLVFASRVVSEQVIQDTKAFKSLEFDVGTLAAVLNSLDPATDIRLLSVEYYFYHKDSRQFVFAHHPPEKTESMITLKDRLSLDCFPEDKTPLEQRLKLAHKLAEAVLFLHMAGFLHKNITATSVMIFDEWDESDEQNLALGGAYLMGFDIIRGTESRTTKEGIVCETKVSRTIWDLDIYQHSDRHQGDESPRYSKIYDVYSLGVLLLELGLWQPLSSVAIGLEKDDPSKWTKYLSNVVAKSLRPRVGVRYERVVLWCLGLDVNTGMRKTDFVDRVLDPLEEMAEAHSIQASLTKNLGNI